MSESILTVCLVNVVTLLVGMLVAFFVALSKRAAENIAMNANFQNVLEQLKVQTAATENIKAAISDDVWDRQKQWEMKRDVVDEAVRTLGELESATINLLSYYSISMPDREDAKSRALGKQREARERFDLCSEKYYRVMFSTDLVVGEILANRLSGYFQNVGCTALQILNGDADTVAKSNTKQALANEAREIIQVAREVLGIERSG